jgi:hypothetical protein
VIDLGDTVPLTVDVTDSDGDPAAADTIVLTVTLPDGTTVTPAVSNPTLGRYQVDYLTTQAGRHEVRWVSTGPGSAYTDVFDVRSASPGYIVSLAELKEHFNIPATDTSHDAELPQYAASATEVVEALVGPVARRTVVEDHIGALGDTLFLRQRPVIELTSVNGQLTGTESYAVEDLDVFTGAGLLRRLVGGTFAGPLRVTYVAGRTIVPERYKMAALIIARHLWETQRGAGGPRLGGYNEAPVPGFGFAIPRRAAELLEQDIIPTVA